MTEDSYQMNVRRGVTGRYSDTCLLASFDRICRHACVSAQLYEAYAEMCRKFWAACEGLEHVPADIAQESLDLQQQLWRELGAPTPKNNNHKRAGNSGDLEKILTNATNGGFRTVVYLTTSSGGLHSAGLISLGDGYYAARSTSTPFDNEDRVSVAEIFSFLDLPTRFRLRPGGTTYKGTNVVMIAPERKR